MKQADSTSAWSSAQCLLHGVPVKDTEGSSGELGRGWVRPVKVNSVTDFLGVPAVV